MPNNKESRLGSGLEQIFGSNINEILDDIQNHGKDSGEEVREINVEEIRTNPYQPRTHFDEVKLQELADSIKEQGVITPILVRNSSVGYELIAGERRLRASKLAEKETIPAIIMDIDESQMMEISLLENIQRDDLDIIEEANAYQQLMTNLNYTQDQLAKRLGKSRVYVTNTLRLLRLPTEVQTKIQDGSLTMGQARPLITVDDQEDCKKLAEKIIKEGLTARECEKLVKDYKAKGLPPVGKKKAEQDAHLQAVQKNIEDKLATKVKVTTSSINISYGDVDDLNRILEILGLLDEGL